MLILNIKFKHTGCKMATDFSGNLLTIGFRAYFLAENRMLDCSVRKSHNLDLDVSGPDAYNFGVTRMQMRANDAGTAFILVAA